MSYTSIYHLPSTISNHTPLLMAMVNNHANHIKYFEFLNCWIDHESFIDTVSSCWNKSVEGHYIWDFHYKLKRLSSTHSNWSKATFGVIRTKVKEFNDKVKMDEENLVNSIVDDDRVALHHINAEYIRYLKHKSSVLKKKTQFLWFQEGDMNSSYFYALIKGRRRRMHINTIQDDEGKCDVL